MFIYRSHVNDPEVGDVFFWSWNRGDAMDEAELYMSNNPGSTKVDTTGYLVKLTNKGILEFLNTYMGIFPRKRV